MTIPTDELQKINPSAKIELFEFHLVQAIHGSSDVKRFYSGVGLNDFNNIVFQGNTYIPIPMEANGFEYSATRTKLPRPTVRISNLNSNFTALMIAANTVTPKNDLNNCKFVRIVTLMKYLDDTNFEPVTTTTSSTTTIADPADAETVTYTVTVVNVGGSNIFAINGSNNPVLTMKRGSTYIFNQADASNSGHPLAIKSDAGGAQTTIVSGTAGQSGATVTYQPAYPSAPSDLRYYCTVPGNGMGNTITMNNPNTTTQTTTSSSTSQSNPYGTAANNTYDNQTYFIDRKTVESKNFVEFELASALDLQNRKAPKRIITRKDFPSVGTFA